MEPAFTTVSDFIQHLVLIVFIALITFAVILFWKQSKISLTLLFKVNGLTTSERNMVDLVRLCLFIFLASLIYLANFFIKPELIYHTIMIMAVLLPVSVYVNRMTMSIGGISAYLFIALLVVYSIHFLYNVYSIVYNIPPNEIFVSSLNIIQAIGLYFLITDIIIKSDILQFDIGDASASGLNKKKNEL